MRTEVIEIAADCAGWNKFRLDVEILHFWKRMRQQAKLKFARQCQIALQALLLTGNLLVQTRVFNGDGELRCQRGQGALVILGEIAAARMLDVDNSDDFLLVDQRKRQFTSR